MTLVKKTILNSSLQIVELLLDTENLTESRLVPVEINLYAYFQQQLDSGLSFHSLNHLNSFLEISWQKADPDDECAICFTSNARQVDRIVRKSQFLGTRHFLGFLEGEMISSFVTELTNHGWLVAGEFEGYMQTISFIRSGMVPVY